MANEAKDALTSKVRRYAEILREVSPMVAKQIFQVSDIDENDPFRKAGRVALQKGREYGESMTEAQNAELAKYGLPQSPFDLVSGGALPGMFLGRKAAGFEAAKATGKVFEGVDKMPRFEIGDEAAKVKYLPTMGEMSKLGDVMEHPTLYENYPDLKEIPVGQDISLLRKGANAAYDPVKDTLSLSPSETHFSGGDKARILHEIQHAIQEREGFAGGGSPEKILADSRARYSYEYTRNFYKNALENGVEENGQIFYKGLGLGNRNQVQSVLDELESKLENLSYADARLHPEEAYRNLAGEAEARNVVNRIWLGPETRAAQPPLSTMDVPAEKQIILKKRGVGGK